MIKFRDLNRDDHEVSDEQLRNLIQLCNAIQEVEDEYGKELVVTSGFRTSFDQERLDPTRPHSAHLDGLAVDIADEDKKFWNWCVENLSFIGVIGFYLEDKLYTPRHVHLQLKAPLSGNRIFKP